MSKPEPNERETGQATADRRRCPRRYHYASVIAFVVPPESKLNRAVVRDVSLSGIGLHVDCPLEPGTAVVLHLRSLHGTMQTRAARVIHATPYEHGGWLVGCHFTLPLSDIAGMRALQFCAEDDIGPE